MAFVCLCRKRRPDVATVEGLVRSDDDRETESLRSALNDVDFEDEEPRKLVVCLPGGGVAASGLGAPPSAAEVSVVGPLLAVLNGSLANYAYLVRKFCLAELGLPAGISLEAVRERTPIRESALLAKLYERLGTGMLTKLRGGFAFCIYDSAIGRVLAARDPTGTVDLSAGSTRDGSVFVASGGPMPCEPAAVEIVPPGHYMYGFGDEDGGGPQRYCSPQMEVDAFAAAANSAAAAALAGLSLDPSAGDRTRSLDLGPRRRSSSGDSKGSSRRRRSAADRRAGGGG